MDWQRGNIPFFTQPPRTEEEEKLEDEKVNQVDPSIKNPIELVADENSMTAAQNAILSLIKNPEFDRSNVDMV